MASFFRTFSRDWKTHSSVPDGVVLWTSPASQPEQLLKLAPLPQPGSGPEECFRKIAPIKCALLRCCWHHWLPLAKENSSGKRGRKLRTVNIHSAFSGLLERPRHLHKHYRWNGQKGVGGMWDFSHHKTAVLWFAVNVAGNGRFSCLLLETDWSFCNEVAWNII